MARQHREAAEGHRLARALRRRIGEEIRVARESAGLGQRHAAEAAGMSHAQFGRIERGMLEGLSIDQVCRAGFAVGLRFSGRFFADGDPARDAPSQRALERFVAVLPSFARVDREVPMAIPGDRRAWDAVVTLDGRRAGCEAETHLSDVQALERKLALKLRDGEVDVLILVVSDSVHNREVLERHRESLRPLLPLDGHAIRRALRDGHLPRANGILVI